MDTDSLGWGSCVPWLVVCPWLPQRALVAHRHCSLLVRKPGFPGQPTHSHAYTTPDLEEPEMGMQLVRTLCYPGGFGKDREGGEPSPA